jgi:hypothetical protein
MHPAGQRKLEIGNGRVDPVRPRQRVAISIMCSPAREVEAIFVRQASSDRKREIRCGRDARRSTVFGRL